MKRLLKRKSQGPDIKKISLNVASGSVKSSRTGELSMREDETPEGRRLDAGDNSKEHRLVLMHCGRLAEGSDQAEAEVFGKVFAL